MASQKQRQVRGWRGDLQIDEDLPFQRGMWWFERAGWAVVGLLIAAALAGLFGRGPLAHASIEPPDAGYRVGYDRLVRYQAPSELVIELDAALAEEGELTVWIDAGFLDAVDLSTIVPEPERRILQADQVGFVFAAGDSDRVEVAFHFEADRIGPITGAAGVPGNLASFTLFVFP